MPLMQVQVRGQAYMAAIHSLIHLQQAAFCVFLQALQVCMPPCAAPINTSSTTNGGHLVFPCLQLEDPPPIPFSVVQALSSRASGAVGHGPPSTALSLEQLGLAQVPVPPPLVLAPSAPVGAASSGADGGTHAPNSSLAAPHHGPAHHSRAVHAVPCLSSPAFLVRAPSPNPSASVPATAQGTAVTAPVATTALAQGAADDSCCSGPAKSH
jgi:hypothetical protein